MNKVIPVTTDQILNKHFNDFISGQTKGKINLMTPVINIIEWKAGINNPYSIALDISDKDMERLIYYAGCIVKNPKESEYQTYDIIPIQEFDNYKASVHTKFATEEEIKAHIPDVLFGAYAIDFLLTKINIKTELTKARSLERTLMQQSETFWNQHLEDNDEFTTEEAKQLSLININLVNVRTKIDALYYIMENKTKLIISEINIFPIDIITAIRENNPLYELGHIQKAYESIIMRNTRLRRLIDINAPEIIIHNEQRVLQEHVDNLIANGRRGKPKAQTFNNIDEEDNSEEMASYPYASLLDIVQRHINFV